MKTILEQISDIVSKGFEKKGYEASYGRVTFSNRPDLCEFQCNGAMAGAKAYHKAPMVIAQEVADALSNEEAFEEISAAAPGFLNIRLSAGFLAGYLGGMESEDRFGLETGAAKKIIVDYGGPNVAKPLHCAPR